MHHNEENLYFRWGDWSNPYFMNISILFYLHWETVAWGWTKPPPGPLNSSGASSQRFAGFYGGWLTAICGLSSHMFCLGWMMLLGFSSHKDFFGCSIAGLLSHYPALLLFVSIVVGCYYITAGATWPIVLIYPSNFARFESSSQGNFVGFFSIPTWDIIGLTSTIEAFDRRAVGSYASYLANGSATCLLTETGGS